jgi:hypothetical protein
MECNWEHSEQASADSRQGVGVVSTLVVGQQQTLHEQKQGTSERKKIMNLQGTARTRTSETAIEEEMNLRGATNLEVSLSRMRMVICLQIPTTF